MAEDIAVSRRAWLVGLAGRAAGRVVEAVEDRLPAPLVEPDVDAVAPDEVEVAVVEPVPTRLHLRDNRCIAVLGIDCGACARLCPAGVRGLWMERRKPVIDPAACTSCGACVDACPTSPRALELVPVPVASGAADRPSSGRVVSGQPGTTTHASPLEAGAEPASTHTQAPSALAEGTVAEGDTDEVVEPVRPDWSVPR